MTTSDDETAIPPAAQEYLATLIHELTTPLLKVVQDLAFTVQTAVHCQLKAAYLQGRLDQQEADIALADIAAEEERRYTPTMRVPAPVLP